MMAQTAPFHGAPDTRFEGGEEKDDQIPSPAFWEYSRANKPGPRTWLTDERRQAVVACREFGMVPLAIADYLGFSDATVARYLREAVRRGEIEPLPPWLTLRAR